MAARVFLHIGLPKSGTTYLQTTMWHNRSALRAQGFLYPGARRMDHFHGSQDVRHQGTHPTGKWEQLCTELQQWPKAGLISHEFFSMATSAQAVAAVADLAPAQVDVVVSARDYVRQFPAVWQEALKMSSQLSLDDFMEAAFAERLPGAWSWRSQDLPAVLRRWSAAVPAERVHLVTVPPASAPRELLWQRWCSVLGIDDTDFDMARSSQNESLGASQAALLWRVKPHLRGPLRKKPVQHRWVRQYFGHEVLVPQGGSRFGLRATHVERLRRRALDDVEAIAAGNYSVAGELADLVPPIDQPTLPHPDDVGTDELLDAAADAIDTMIRDVRRLTAQRDRARAAAQEQAPLTSTPRALARRLSRWGRRLTP